MALSLLFKYSDPILSSYSQSAVDIALFPFFPFSHLLFLLIIFLFSILIQSMGADKPQNLSTLINT